MRILAQIQCLGLSGDTLTGVITKAAALAVCRHVAAFGA